MSTPSSSAPSPGPERSRARLAARPDPAERRAASPVDATGRRRDLEIAVATVVGMAAVVSGPLIWVVALLVLAATILGTLQLLAEVDGPDADRGVPVESLIVPAVAAIGGGRRHPARAPRARDHPGARRRRRSSSIGRSPIEERIVGAAQGPTADDRTASLVAILVVALVAFVGVAAESPAGWRAPEPAGRARRAAVRSPNLVVLALADAVVAGLLGYRAAALRTASARDALWAALTYAVAIAIGAAAVRAIGIPRLIGPALLMFLFYLWDTLHAAPPSRRRDPRWLWETAILARPRRAGRRLEPPPRGLSPVTCRGAHAPGQQASGRSRSIGQLRRRQRRPSLPTVSVAASGSPSVESCPRSRHQTAGVGAVCRHRPPFDVRPLRCYKAWPPPGCEPLGRGHPVECANSYGDRLTVTFPESRRRQRAPSTRSA